jgi:hypothetical protein
VLSKEEKAIPIPWPIDILSKGDLYVADAFGKISGGPNNGC